MKLENCKCKCEANTCCEEHIDQHENLLFNENVDSYEDYLKNKKFCEVKKKTLKDDFLYCQRMEDENEKYLKNLFLSEFVNSEKQIKGLCIHETKFLKEPYRQIYVYIIEVKKHNISEKGIFASVISVYFNENNGHNENVAICSEDNHYISYEKLCSCQITNDEFMDIYDSANLEIIAGLGLNKVNDNC